MIGAQFLALRIAYVIKQSHKNRLTISEAKLKLLAEKEVLSIFYLADLKQSLEELGYFLGSLKKGKYCLLAIESLEGAPSLPIKEDMLKQLASLSEDELEKHCITSAMIEPITDNEQDEEKLLLNELWVQLTKAAADKKNISYGELAKSLTNVFSYKVHHKKVMALLERIKQYCSENSLPKLDYLAINAKLDLPKALEKEQDAKIKFAEEKANIYDFDWRTIANPFVDKNSKTDTSMQTTPVLPLDDLSSKGSIIEK